MKGFKCIFHDKIIDNTPCFFCKHRKNLTVESPCYGCIETTDLALHKQNADTEFANFEPLSPAHSKVLEIERGLFI